MLVRQTWGVAGPAIRPGRREASIGTLSAEVSDVQQRLMQVLGRATAGCREAQIQRLAKRYVQAISRYRVAVTESLVDFQQSSSQAGRQAQSHRRQACLGVRRGRIRIKA